MRTDSTPVFLSSIDVNRMKLLEANAFETIIAILAKSPHADSIKTASGALLNTTMACGKDIVLIWLSVAFTRCKL